MGWLMILLVSLVMPAVADAQPWSGLLDPARAIDWSTAGVRGIPNRTSVCATVAASTYGNGGSDATAGIQAALNACPGNQVVSLSAGVFRINGTLVIPSHVTLRGAGPAQTTLDLRGSGPAAVRFGAATSATPSAGTPITGAAKGSTTITVGSAAGIGAGTLLMISQRDLGYMSAQGSNGACDWCDAGWPNAMNSGQIVEVEAVNGTSVTVTPALYTDYTNGPMAYRFSAGARAAGLEALKLRANKTGYTANILMSGSVGCWVKNVESDFADGDHMRIYWGLRNEVRDNFFHDGFNHGPGGTDNSLMLAHKSSANLVQNNIFYRQHVSVMLQWGAAGNVIAYNYSTGSYHQDWLAWMINDFNFHGAHPMMNLFESNVGVKFQPDSTWGSSSHSTLLRNWFLGSNQYVPPLNARGPLQPQNAQWESANTFAYSIDYPSVYNHLIGNVAGSPRLTSSGAVNMRVSPAAGGSNPACYRIGYNSDNDAAVNPNNAYSTLLFHGNLDCVTGTVQWTLSNRTIPPSFYLPGRPAWFGALQWPAIGPGVTGGGGANGFARKIPAQVCFEQAPRDGNGMPIFAPGGCYGSEGSAGQPPSPPSGLTVR